MARRLHAAVAAPRDLWDASPTKKSPALPPETVGLRRKGSNTAGGYAMTVKAVLRTKGGEVFSMPPQATLQEVSEELSRRKVGAVVILDGEELVGILSERDIVRTIARKGARALELPATAAMTAKVETCRLDDKAVDVMARMSASRFRHMPVVEDGRLIGLVSIGDVVKRRIDEALQERDEIKAYIHSI